MPKPSPPPLTPPPLSAVAAISADVSLIRFLSSTLDAFRDELEPLTLALFAHTYLKLINDHPSDQPAREFLQARGPTYSKFHGDVISSLSQITDRQYIGKQAADKRAKAEWVFRLLEQKFEIAMSRYSAEALMSHLIDNKHDHLITIIACHVHISIQNTAPAIFQPSSVTRRIVAQAEAGRLVAAGIDSEKFNVLNSTPIAWGVPSAQSTTAPLPDLNSSFWNNYKQFVLAPAASAGSSASSSDFPSIALLSFLNSSDGLTSVSTSASASTVAGGFEDSTIRIWHARQGEMMGRTSQLLVGHSDCVYDVSLWDERALVSASGDGTIRLWALPSAAAPFQPVSIFQAGLPQWAVDFAPHGYYFCSGGQDRICRLWACDRSDPLRVFAGHQSDISVVRFHPNAHYIATCSDDKTIRLWDVQSGRDCRVLVGHLGTVTALAFDPSGRWLASGARDGLVIVWDLASGRRMTVLEDPHTLPVTCLTWTPDGAFLASGGADCVVKVWRCSTFEQETAREFPTKFTPLVHLAAPSARVLMAAGSFAMS